MVRVGIRLGPFYISESLRGRKPKYVVPKRDVPGLNPRQKRNVLILLGAIALFLLIGWGISALTS